MRYDAPPRNHTLLTQRPNIRYRVLSFEFFSSRVSPSLKQCRLVLLPTRACGYPIAEDTKYFGHGSWEKSSWYCTRTFLHDDWPPFIKLVSAYLAGTEKNHQQSCSAGNNNDSPGKMCSVVQWWHRCLRGRQPTNSCLMGFKPCLTGENSCLAL